MYFPEFEIISEHFAKIFIIYLMTDRKLLK